MSKDIKAFPSNELEWSKSQGLTQDHIVEQHLGMTLRDYFAAKAMQSFIINTDYKYLSTKAKKAWDMADAMLKEREK